MDDFRNFNQFLPILGILEQMGGMKLKWEIVPMKLNSDMKSAVGQREKFAAKVIRTIKSVYYCHAVDIYAQFLLSFP